MIYKNKFTGCLRKFINKKGMFLLTMVLRGCKMALQNN